MSFSLSDSDDFHSEYSRAAGRVRVSLVRQCFLFLLFSVRTVCSIIIWDGTNVKTAALDSCMNLIDVTRMIIIRATINVTLAASQQRSDHLFFLSAGISFCTALTSC